MNIQELNKNLKPLGLRALPWGKTKFKPAPGRKWWLIKGDVKAMPYKLAFCASDSLEMSALVASIHASYQHQVSRECQFKNQQ